MIDLPLWGKKKKSRDANKPDVDDGDDAVDSLHSPSLAHSRSFSSAYPVNRGIIIIKKTPSPADVHTYIHTYMHPIPSEWRAKTTLLKGILGPGKHDRLLYYDGRPHITHPARTDTYPSIHSFHFISIRQRDRHR